MTKENEDEKTETPLSQSAVEGLVIFADGLNPLLSIADAMSFWAGDWGQNSRLAWIYGIVHGWDDDSLDEPKKKHSWNQEAVERLKQLHKNYIEIEKQI